MFQELDVLSASDPGVQDLSFKKKSKGHKCYLCGDRFINIHVLRKHVNIHKDRDLECNLCGKNYSSTCGLKKHMAIHTGERPHKCPYCVKAFRQKCTMLDHVQNVHESTKPRKMCVSCGKTLRSNSNVSQCWMCVYEERIPNSDTSQQDVNAENSNTEPSSKADYSIQKFTNSESPPLIEKIESESRHLLEARSVSCIMCCKSFPTYIELRAHTAQNHKEERLFYCEVCGNRFATSLSLQNHLRTHSEVRPFVCMVCNKYYKTQFALKNHLNTHRPDRPFVCKVCGCAFKTQITLKTHMIVHVQQRPFQCRHCNFSFKTLDRLKKHVSVHSEEKPYHCEKCGKKFRHPGNLGRHYYLHLDKRLFICNICGKEFAQSCGLKQHEQVHDKEYEAKKTLSCPFCGKAYKLIWTLQRHMVKHQ